MLLSILLYSIDMKIKPLAFVAFVFLSMLAVQAFAQGSQKNLTSLVIDGQEYLFSTNLYDAIKIPVKNETEIKSLFESYDEVCIIFNGSSEQDNAYFSAVLYNDAFKIVRYYTLQGRSFGMPSCNEYNASEIIIPILLIKGPNTGATENSITLNGTNIIIMQGTDAKGIKMVGDKLALIVLGINDLESFEDKGIPVQSILIVIAGIILLIAVIYLIYRESRKKEEIKKREIEKPKEEQEKTEEKSKNESKKTAKQEKTKETNENNKEKNDNEKEQQ